MSEQIDILLAGILGNDGAPLAGGKVYSYDAGTTTPKAIYEDVTLGTAAANPTILDAYGRALRFATGSYKFIIADSDDNVVATWDNLQFESVAGSSSSGSNERVYCGSAGGSANAITLSPSPALTAYSTGECYLFKASLDNTGAVTVNISSLGAKSAVGADSIALGAGMIRADEWYELVYDGTKLVLLSSTELGSLVKPDGTVPMTGTLLFPTSGFYYPRIRSTHTYNGSNSAGDAGSNAIASVINLFAGDGDFHCAITSSESGRLLVFENAKPSGSVNIYLSGIGVRGNSSYKASGTWITITSPYHLALFGSSSSGYVQIGGPDV